MPRKPSPANLLQQVPKKWAVAIVFALIAYTVVQPFANQRFGWSLPSVASLLGQEQAGDKPSPRDAEPRTADEKPSQPTSTESKSTESKSSSGAESPLRNDAGVASKPSRTSGDSVDLKYGLLKEIGEEVYLSPAGLRYTKGSDEGHRLKHVEKHLSDQPDRPGSHGVFYGDMPQVLRWIDEAFEASERGDRGVSSRQDQGMTVIEMRFDKPIGFVGGQTGKRKNHPDADRLRLVIDKDRVITAFPF